MLRALGLVRGELYSVQFGSSDKFEIERVLQSTSLANIAAALGLSEAEIAIDCDSVLTREELNQIAGFPSRP